MRRYLHELPLLSNLVLAVFELGGQRRLLGGEVLDQSGVRPGLVTQVCEFVLGFFGTRLERPFCAQGFCEIELQLGDAGVVACGRRLRRGLAWFGGGRIEFGAEEVFLGFESCDAVGELGAWGAKGQRPSAGRISERLRDDASL